MSSPGSRPGDSLHRTRAVQPATTTWICKQGVTSLTSIGSLHSEYIHRRAKTMMLRYRWRCPVGSCKQSVSLRSGTFFDKSRMSLKQWLVLFYWWAREYPVTDATEEAEVEKKTAIQAYQYCRDICSWRLLHRDSPLLPGVTVQIDESLFRHKPKVGSWF